MGKMKNILIIVLSIAVIGAGAVFFLGKDVLGFGNVGEKSMTAEDIAELSVDTEVITTNLASNNFAIVQFNILLTSKEAKEELEKRTPEVKSAIISTLASYKKNEIVGEEGLIKLENNISSRMELIVGRGNVDRVLITEFKVQ